MNWTAADGTALAGFDYRATNGVVAFSSGQTNRFVSVYVIGDILPEADETFQVQLSDPVNAIAGDMEGVGIIADDDPAWLAVADSQVTEGTGNDSTLTFVVTLSPASSLPVSVNFATAGGGATSGVDFFPTNGVLSFAPGQTQQSISVTVVGDALDEPLNEDLFVNLSSPEHALLADDQAVGTIVDDDLPPVASVNDVTVVEGSDAGSTNAVFTVQLSTVSALPVSVRYHTENGTATAPADFLAANSIVNFNPGETSRTVAITVISDLLDESDETFAVVLSDPINATLGGSQGSGTIVDDDVTVLVSITNAVAVAEGNTGSTPAPFAVSLSAPSSQVVTVNLTTADGTATSPTDFLATNGVVTFAPGETSQLVSVTVNGDVLDEDDESFTVTLSNPVGALLAAGATVSLATILDDDPLPTLLIAPQSQLEGNSGASTMNCPLRLSTASGRTVKVDYTTADGSAHAPEDYRSASGSVTFTPGEIAKSVPVPILGDTSFESDEQFTVNLSNPVNAAISLGQATGEIRNDDAQANQPPTVRLTHPADQSVFSVHEAIEILAEAEDPDDAVARVEFYLGSTLVGVDSSRSYTHAWTPEFEGDYYLTARAYDTRGASATSAPVHVVVSKACGRAVIVRCGDHEEADKLASYLFELGVQWEMVDREQASFDRLKDFDVIVWDDPSAAALTAAEVQVMTQLLAAAKAQYFIGEDLANVDPENGATRPRWRQPNHPAERKAGLPPAIDPATAAIWYNLLHLQPSTVASCGSAVAIDRSSQGVTDPVVLEGKVGTVADFRYDLPLPAARARGRADERILGRAGSCEVLVAWADDNSNDAVRSVTQAFRVWSGDEEASLTERKKLFQNAMWWLLNCRICQTVQINVFGEGSNEIVNAGQELTYTMTVQQTGECDALGVVFSDVLPPDVELVSVASERGRWELSPGRATCLLGHFDSAQGEQLRVVVRPTVPGLLTNVFSIHAFNTDGDADEIVTVVRGLRIQCTRGPGGQVELRVSGYGGPECQLESSTDLRTWTPGATYPLVNGAATILLPPVSGAQPQFFRARLL